MSGRALVVGAAALAVAFGVAALLLALDGGAAEESGTQVVAPPERSFGAGAVSLGGDLPDLAAGGEGSAAAPKPATLPVPVVEASPAPAGDEAPVDGPAPSGGGESGGTGSASGGAPPPPEDPGGGVVGASGG